LWFGLRSAAICLAGNLFVAKRHYGINAGFASGGNQHAHDRRNKVLPAYRETCLGRILAAARFFCSRIAK
jgi:hypothetical protein